MDMTHMQSSIQNIAIKMTLTLEISLLIQSLQPMLSLVNYGLHKAILGSQKQIKINIYIPQTSAACTFYPESGQLTFTTEDSLGVNHLTILKEAFKTTSLLACLNVSVS